jgi:1,4-alpha-glucan branching enzyme
MYAFSENFVLPFSHDEVVHLKRSMLDKMPGDRWQKFANLRALYAYMIGHPGKKLLFMGSEFGQWREWSEARSLDWHLLAEPDHRQLQHFVAAVNQLYLHEPALYEVDFHWNGFHWIDLADAAQSVISFSRHGTQPEDLLVFVCNFTPTPRLNYRVGLPENGHYREIFNSDQPQYGGSGIGNQPLVVAEPVVWQQCGYSALLNLPPLGVFVLKLAQS